MAQLSSIVPKLHLRLMPVLLMMYVLAFLDRANVSFAKAGLALDVGIGNAAFAFGASIFFVGYAVLEVPSNLALHRFGARRWMARIMITWGIVSAANAFVTGPSSFYAVRFLLGMMEAGFFPGVIYYMTYWYPTAARARSVGLFYYGAPLALTFGGPISGQLVAHDAFGLHGWQVMFLIEGLLASLGGIAVLFLLHDRPEQAPWLNADEKTVLRAALAEDEGAREHPSVLTALCDVRVLYLALVYFLVEAGFYGLTFYLPTQVARLLGTSIGLKVGLVSSLPWICALVAVTVIPPWCDARGNARGIGAPLGLEDRGGDALAAGGVDRLVFRGRRIDRVAGFVLDPADAAFGRRGSRGRHRAGQLHRQSGRLCRAEPARLAGCIVRQQQRGPVGIGRGVRDRRGILRPRAYLTCDFAIESHSRCRDL